MRAAVLREYGRPPQVEEFDEPEPRDGAVVAAVVAGGLNPVDLSRASGSFYRDPPPLPSVAGSEGVARLPGGELAYFGGAVAPYGSFAERTLVDPERAVPLPEGLDPALAVCLGVAGLAAWLALEWRAQLRAGETVLVLGASGVVGQLAVQVARVLGAGRIVAAARDAEGLERARRRGAHSAVRLDAPAGGDLAGALREASGGEGYDVVVDPLWGEPGAAATEACAPYARFVQLGQSAGATAEVSSSTVRGKQLAILGHTSFRMPDDVKRRSYERLAELGAAGELEADIERVPLEQAPEAWERQRHGPHAKLVIVPG